MAQAARLGRGAGLEDQPAGAHRDPGPGRARLPHRGRPAPTTRRPSPGGRSWPASTTVGQQGRTKKEAEQRAAESAWLALSAAAADGGDPRQRGVPPVPEPARGRDRSARDSRKWVARSDDLHCGGSAPPRAVRRHAPGAADFGAILAGRTITDVRRRGKYLWLALDSDDAIVGHPGHVRPDAAARRGPAGRAAPAGAVQLHRRRAAVAVRGPAHVRRARGLARRRRTCPPRSPTSPGIRSIRSTSARTWWPRCAPGAPR
jgi:hypothetical protein